MTPDTLRTLDREATPGPWKVTHRAGHYAVEGGAPEGHAQPIVARAAGLETAEAEANARLIAYVRTHLPEIIAHLDAGWLPIWQAPYQVAVEVRVGRMTFLAMLMPDASMTDAGASCDQWRAVHEGEHPPCWSGGACWASNEDGVRSLQPIAFRHLPHPPAGEGGRG